MRHKKLLNLLERLIIRAPFGGLCVLCGLWLTTAVLCTERPSTVTLVPSDSTHSQPRLPKVPSNKTKSRDTATKTVKTGTVVVTGTRSEVELKDSPVRVEVVDAASLKGSGSTSLNQVLEDQSGVGISNGLHTGVQLQGMSADYTQILVDGQPLISRVAGVIDLNRIAVGNVRQVEVVKGPMSSLYGSEALAGVINLITVKPRPGWTGGLTLQTTTHMGQEPAVNVGFSNDDLDWSLFCDYRNSSPFNLTADTLTIPYSGFRDVTVQSQAKFYISPTFRISGSVRNFHSHSVGTFVESYFGQIAQNTGSVDQSELGSRLAAEWIHGDAHAEASLYYARFSEDYNFDVVQGSGTNLDNMARSYLKPSVQYDVFFNQSNRLIVGTEYVLDRISGTRYDSVPSYTTGVVYGQWEGNPLSWLSYAASAREDVNNEYGGNLSPKFSALVKLDENFSLRSSIGSGFKAPDFRQLYVFFRNNLQGAGYVLEGAHALGNTLEPERALSYDLSFSCDCDSRSFWSAMERFHAEIRAFHSTVSNMIEYYLDHVQGSVAVYSYHNLSHVRTQGLELTTSATWTLSSWLSMRAKGSYQYVDAADVDVLAAIDAGSAGTTDPKTGSFIPLTRSNYGGLWYVSKHLANVCLDLCTTDGWVFSSRADFVGKFGDEALDRNGSVLSSLSRAVPDLATEYVASYWNLKCSLTKEFSLTENALHLSSLRLSVGAMNLLDHLDLRSLPSLLGRQFYLQLNGSW